MCCFYFPITYGVFLLELEYLGKPSSLIHPLSSILKKFLLKSSIYIYSTYLYPGFLNPESVCYVLCDGEGSTYVIMTLIEIQVH